MLDSTLRRVQDAARRLSKLGPVIMGITRAGR